MSSESSTVVQTKHCQSQVVLDSGLDIFTCPPTSASFQSVEDAKVYPTTPLGAAGDIIFDIQNLTLCQFLNLADSFIVFRGSLKKGAAAQNISVVNNFASAFVKCITVYLNDVLVSSYDNFTYRNVLDNLLHTPIYEKETLRRVQFFAEHGLSTPGITAGDFTDRKTFTQQDEFEWITHLNCDIASTSKFLPSGLNVKIKVSLNESTFYTLGEVDTSANIVLTDCYLNIQKAMAFTSVALGIEKIISQRPASFHLRHVKTFERTLAIGSARFTFDLNMDSNLPNYLSAVLLKSTTFVGAVTTDPTYFALQNLKRAKLITDVKNIEYDFTNKVLAYYQFLRALKEPKASITYKQYYEGCMILVFDLTFLAPRESLRRVIKSNARLELEFNAPITDPLTMVFLSEGTANLQISSDRAVTWTS